MTENKLTFKDLDFKQHECFPVFDQNAFLVMANGKEVSVTTGKLAKTNSQKPYEVSIGDKIFGYLDENQVTELMLVNQ